jgi:hypothetical protein
MAYRFLGMAYWFLGIKLLPGTHHLFLGIGRMFPGTPKLFLGTFWLLGTVPRNAENQNEQVSFSFLFPWSLECKKRDPAESDLPIRQTSGRMRVHNAPPHNTISILPSERHVGLWDMVPSQSLLNQSLLHLSLLHSALLCGLWCEGIGIVRARLRHGGRGMEATEAAGPGGPFCLGPSLS